MEFCHTDSFLDSPAAQMIAAYRQERRANGAVRNDADGAETFERIEQTIHTLVMALERELVSEALSQYDTEAQKVEVGGKVYRRGARLSESYLTAAGPVSVERNLYYPVGEKGKSICPMELRSGIIAGFFTPRAAKQGAFAMAHLTPGECEMLFDEIDNMHPSRSSLDRLTKALSPHWEDHRESWEAKLRENETVPATATVLAISVDGVMAPMRGTKKPEKMEQAESSTKQASGPKGYKEVGCGTVTLYNSEAERLQTVRYGRMPESKKVTLQQQLETETATILATNPDLLRVHLADGAKDNWRLMNDIEAQLPAPSQAPVEITDFYHACDHLKNGCDAAWGDNSQKSQTFFERLKTTLKERDNGVALVIRTLRLQFSRARGHKRERLETELTYFGNQQPRMNYAEFIRLGLPIASGVMEAACKTLVTQRMKRSGMLWTNEGGQSILTLRSLVQSNRWDAAWALLSADFRIPVNVPDEPTHYPGQVIFSGATPFNPSPHPTQPLDLFEGASLMLAER